MSSTAAAVVQAIAACVQLILTVAVIYISAQLQDRAIARRERAALDQRLRAIEGLLMTARDTIASQANVMANLPPPEYDPGRIGGAALELPAYPERGYFRQLEKALAGVPVHELPSWEFGLPVMSMLGLLSKAEESFRQFASEYRMGRPSLSAMNEHTRSADLLLKGFSEARQRLSAADRTTLSGLLLGLAQWPVRNAQES